MAPNKKVTTTQGVQDFCTTLAAAWEKAEAITEVFYDRGFSGNITDDDILDPTGSTAEELNLGITLANQFIEFLKGRTVITGDYLSTVNKLRTDV